MKFIDEFRDPKLARRLVAQIRQRARRPVRLMEFCGGHTHAIFRFGLRQLLAGAVELSSGPGCPVCVTAAGDLDRAIALAEIPEVILTTFGDMIRVPGSHGTLQEARARGADVRVVYSPLDAVEIAQQNPSRQVIFLGVGFETTAPGIAATLLQAQAREATNFSLLSLHKLTPPAMRAILEAGEVRLDGIIGPGHVSAIIGSRAWSFLPREHAIACAVSGFEPLDMLSAIAALVDAAVDESPAVVNAYGRGVCEAGNPVAQEMMGRVFERADSAWRGFGEIPQSGLTLREPFAAFDATRRFPVSVEPAQEPPGCRCGEVLRGVIEPPACALFGQTCTPRDPVGPCMVSAEGACAAFYTYRELD